MKAFARLAARLKKDFPQLPFCLLLDGLYANGTVMSICEKNGWKYIITFKEGSLPAFWQEYQSLLKLCPQNRKTVDAGGGEADLRLGASNWSTSTTRNAAIRSTPSSAGSRRAESHFFAWLTNFPVNQQNVAALGNRGGRCRWKIENEGFNIQKNSGFNLEHAYSTGDRQIKNFYVLLQIAHLILQLLERGSLLTRDAKQLFGSLKNLASRLLESVRNVLIGAEALDAALAAKIQIRLNSG